jgi:hypothetical protein
MVLSESFFQVMPVSSVQRDLAFFSAMPAAPSRLVLMRTMEPHYF